MHITRLLHTAILVSDLAKAEHFYGEVLGLVKAEGRTSNFAGTWYQIGDCQLHLIVHPEFRNQIFNQTKWGRNPHFAIAVDNLAEAIARLQSKGYPMQMSASGRAAYFIQDPDQNILEISQG
jgi:catechol 2,3-dioxygenase-like lactoylglutathione lyase family enzyme